ncbi:hypothetical protein L0U85_03765 [Glycomyces sp. L485]|uniref:hypothetical protein n=1 Tax=Glycomyces sp. L485 TaxID=2909235 RepID=UPI001F4BA4F5|nr:hypothetical protein [Glycomyces sp. L485]MCH7229979.1 hypothetical protein [Glycomyces sp. L485]
MTSPKLGSFRWLGRTLIVHGTATWLTLKLVEPGSRTRDVALCGPGAGGQWETGWLIDKPPTGLQTAQLFRTGTSARVQALYDHLFAGADLDPALGIRVTAAAREAVSQEPPKTIRSPIR